MSDVTIEALFSNVAALLERHTEILVNHSNAINQIVREVAKLNEELRKAKSDDSIDSTDADAKFVKDMTTRLESISQAIKEKRVY